MFKNISLGLGALIIVMTAGTLAMPQKAEAAACKLTMIPNGFVPSGNPCGRPGCSGEVYTHRHFGSMCVITDNQT